MKCVQKAAVCVVACLLLVCAASVGATGMAEASLYGLTCAELCEQSSFNCDGETQQHTYLPSVDVLQTDLETERRLAEFLQEIVRFERQTKSVKRATIVESHDNQVGVHVVVAQLSVKDPDASSDGPFQDVHICSEFHVKDVDECALGIDWCNKDAHTVCVNTEGSYRCDCEEGYEPDRWCRDVQQNNDECKSKITCVDTDECATGAHDCGDNSVCVNTEGSFLCECADGFQDLTPSADDASAGRGCVDIDECLEESHDCSGHAECINTQGGFECKCHELFVGDGHTSGSGCTPQNICESGTHDCVGMATCTGCTDTDLADCHTLPSSGDVGMAYRCNCPAGHRGDGTVSGSGCENVDECAEGTHRCDVHADCHDTDGAYSCTCQEGYEGNGFECHDIDECHGDCECGEASVCVNLEGSYRCECKPGFVEQDGKCVDTSPPTIALVGPNPYVITQYSEYEEWGFSVVDENAEHATRRVAIEYPDALMTRFAETAGTFEVTYAIETPWTDPSEIAVTRTVIVEDCNECEEDCNGHPAACPPNALCINEPLGSYGCACSAGYEQQTQEDGSIVCADAVAPVIVLAGDTLINKGCCKCDSDISTCAMDGVSLGALCNPQDQYTDCDDGEPRCFRAYDLDVDGNPTTDLTCSVKKRFEKHEDQEPPFWSITYTVADEAGNDAPAVGRTVTFKPKDVLATVEKLEAQWQDLKDNFLPRDIVAQLEAERARSTLFWTAVLVAAVAFVLFGGPLKTLQLVRFIIAPAALSDREFMAGGHVFLFLCNPFSSYQARRAALIHQRESARLGVDLE